METRERALSYDRVISEIAEEERSESKERVETQSKRLIIFQRNRESGSESE